MSAYVEYSFKIEPLEPASEILIAELGQLGFESFVESNTGLQAYILLEKEQPALVNDIYILNNPTFTISFTRTEIAQENWNAQWEKSFQPINVNNRVSIRAPFHQETKLEFDIIIEPKMSFGTGHHETTYLMVSYLLELDLAQKKVLDMGCGTGILAILSELKGAQTVDAIDIDPWSFKNTLENCQRNNCKHIQVFLGDASILINQCYDLIIANINRNILIADLGSYVRCLDKEGILLLSGFYTEDLDLINKAASEQGLQLIEKKIRNNWLALKYKY